jgi:hypothetical protein
MQQKQAERSSSLINQTQAEKEEYANLFAAAAASATPAPEVQAFFNARLDAYPEVTREYGDLMAQAFRLAFEGFWLGYITKETVRREAERIRQELGHATASPVERLLIDHAVMCHVRLGMVEHIYSRLLRNSYSVRDGEHMERRLTLAQKRFDRAVTTLCRTRALLARADLARTLADRAQGHNGLRAVGPRAA